MFSALLNAPCELRLHLLQSVIFLYPPHRQDVDDLDTPPNQTDSLVRGLVELYVPTPRHIAGIKVKLRALQTVAILDTGSNQVPVSWEDKVLLEKEVRIGVPLDHESRKSNTSTQTDRGRTSTPSTSRPRRNPSEQAHTPQQVASPRPPFSRRASQTPSLGASNDHSEGETEDGDERAGRPTSVAAAFVRAVSRGRNHGSRPNSTVNSPSNSRVNSPSHSRATSPTSRTRRLDTFASTSNSSALRSASMAPAILPPSPVLAATPRDQSPHGDRLNSTIEEIVDDDDSGGRGRRPGAASRSNSELPLSERLAATSLSIGQNVERARAASHRGGLGHPSSDDFGLKQPKPSGNARSGLGSSSGPAVAGGVRGRGGLAKRREGSRDPGGSVPPRLAAAVDDRSEIRSSSLGGWARFGRSVSRARGAGSREVNTSKTRRKSPAEDGQAGGEERALDQASGLFLEKGVHGFEFAFILPANSAEYTRSPFGRVRYVIKAVAYGAGRARSNVEGWRDFFPVANPSTEGGPTPLTVLYNDIHPTVGVMSIACTSQNISVGGFFQIDIHSPIPPSDLIVYLVRISLDTTIELITKRKGKQKVPAQRQKLFEKGYVPARKEDPYSSGDGNKEDGSIRDPAIHGPDSAWTVQAMARMPDDNAIRSSTITGTKADIRFSHQIVVEIVHSRDNSDPTEPRKLKVFTLRQPITLPSCCVAFDAATLPAYTPAAENTDACPTIDGIPYNLGSLQNGHLTSQQAANLPSNISSSAAASANRLDTAGPRRGANHDHCVCGLSMQDLETRERAMIPLGTDIPIENLRPHGKIGEILPRRSSSRTSRSSRSSRSVRSGSGGRSHSRSSRRRRDEPPGASSICQPRSLSRSVSRTSAAGISPLFSRTRSSDHRSSSPHSGRSGNLSQVITRDSLGSSNSSAASNGGFIGGDTLHSSFSRSSRLSSGLVQPAPSSPAPPPPSSHRGTELDSTLMEVPPGAASGAGSGTSTPSDQPPSYEVVVEEEEQEDRGRRK